MIALRVALHPWRPLPSQRDLLKRHQRRQHPKATAEEDANFQLSVVEQSVDFSEVEYIQVADPETGSHFRSLEASTDTEELTFSTDDAAEMPEVPAATATGSLLLLGLCTMAYVHCCSAGFSIPALLPSIAADSGLTDSQGALLTVGFTMVYALGQIPFGFLADRTERPQLLSTGVVIWSVVTALASKATSFTDLLLIRLSTAASQSMQNPICYGLIPELFPNKRTTAISLYNCAIYIGRALSFFFALILAKLGVHAAGIKTVPLEQFDVTTMSMLYITGNQATVAPVFDYDFGLIAGNASSWRDLLFWIGIPGLAVAFCLALVPDPRQQKTKTVTKQGIQELWPTILTIGQNRGFQATTFAASLNDIGFWSLISWQALFYERVYGITSDVYAPLLAAIIPVSGIVGGVGGSLLSDWLSQRNARAVLTFGATLVGAPLIFMSFQAADYQSSFIYLLFGYLLSECWRASGAIMVRESSPPDAVSTGAALHLFARNLMASIGPILIATLEPRFGLRNAMGIIPLSYVASALSFGVAEKLIMDESTQ